MTDKKILYMVILIIAAGIAAFLVSRPVKPDTNVPVTLIGNWLSVSDAKFGREFDATGAFYDIYGEDLIDTGTWQPFTKNNPVSTDYPLQQGEVYLEIVGKTTKTQFRVAAIGTSTLDLEQLGGKEIIKFVRK